MSDPTRLLDEPGTSPALRELLGSAHGDGPSAADLARLTGKLGPLLVATAPVGAAAATGASAAAKATTAAAVGQTAAATGILKVSVIAAIGGTVLAAGAFQAGRSYEAAHLAPKLERVVSAPVAPPPPAVVAEPIIEAPVVEPVPPLPDEPVKIARPAPRPVARPAPPPEPKLTEVELLEKAMAAMKGDDAKQALALTARHQAEFASGALIQEREMLAIEALVKLGRGGDARLKADDFRKRYPTSSHLLRLDALVGR
jgi:hypothetical protein